MAVAVTEQGGRVAYLTDTGRKFKEGRDLIRDSISGNGMRFNLYESSRRAPSNVLDLPTVRPINDNDPREKFLGEMGENCERQHRPSRRHKRANQKDTARGRARLCHLERSNRAPWLRLPRHQRRGHHRAQRPRARGDKRPRCSAITCRDAEQAIAARQMRETTWSKEAAQPMSAYARGVRYIEEACEFARLHGATVEVDMKEKGAGRHPMIRVRVQRQIRTDNRFADQLVLVYPRCSAP